MRLFGRSMRGVRGRSAGRLAAALAAALVCAACVAGGDSRVDGDWSLWQECSVFAAPCSMGYGVFANRDFREGEVVEFVPMYVPVPSESPVRNSVLDDYAYGIQRLHFDRPTPQLEEMHALLFGWGMVYNHHPTEQNVLYSSVSVEPGTPGFPDSVVMVVAFVAKRDIRKGEQLYSSYGNQDGGTTWFRNRRLSMQAPALEQAVVQPKAPHQYCSHIQSGIGQSAWKQRIAPVLPPDVPFFLDDVARLPPEDAGYANVYAKHAVRQGQRIEIAPLLVLDRSVVDSVTLSPIAMHYNELSDHNQHALQQARQDGILTVQYQGEDTQWKRIDRFTHIEDVALLPILGSIGMVQRVDDRNQSNCEVFVRSHANLLSIELVASVDIDVGQTLLMHHPTNRKAIQSDSLAAFLTEMELTGQAFIADIETLRQELNERDTKSENDEL